MKKFFPIFANFESWLCQFLLAALVSIIFLQIILRLFSISAPWTEELSRFVFLWFILFGACYAARLQVFNRVTAQFSSLTPKITIFFLSLADLLWIIFSLILAWEGFLTTLHLEEFPYFAPALNFNLFWVYLGFPASFLLMAIRIGQTALARIVTGQISLSESNSVASAQEKFSEAERDKP